MARELSDQDLQLLFEQGTPEDWGLLDDAELDRMRELGQKMVDRQTVIDAQQERVTGAPDPFNFSPGTVAPELLNTPEASGPELLALELQSKGRDIDTGLLPAEIQGPSSSQVVAEAATNPPRTQKETSLTDVIVRSFQSAGGNPVEALQRLYGPDGLVQMLPQSELPKAPKDDAGNPYPMLLAPTLPRVELDDQGRMSAKSLSYLELLAGQPIGQPGVAIPGFRDPRNIEAPGALAIQARRAELLRNLGGEIVPWVRAFWKAVPELVNQELQGEQPISRGVTNTAVAMGDLAGYDVRALNLGPVTVPWISSRKAPAEQLTLAPGDFPHPTEGQIPWPARWAAKIGSFTPPLDPRAPDLWGAGRRYEAMADAVVKGTRQIKNLAAIPLSPEAPDLMDAMVSGMIEGFGLDAVEFIDDEKRQELWNERPEVVLEQIAVAGYGVGSTARTVGAVPKAAKGLNNFRAMAAYARGGPEALLRRLDDLEAVRLDRLARRAAREARGSDAAPVTLQRVEQAQKAQPDTSPELADEMLAAEAMNGVATHTDEAQRIRAMATNVKAATANDDPGLEHLLSQEIRKAEERTQDMVEFLSAAAEPGQRAAVAELNRRLREIPQRLRRIGDAVDQQNGQLDDALEDLEQSARGAQRILEDPGSIPRGDAKLGEVMERLGRVRRESLETERQLLELTRKWQETSQLGRKIPLIAAAGIMAEQLYGGQDANDLDTLAAIGPVALLSALTPGLSKAGQARVVDRVLTRLADRGAELLYKTPDMTKGAFLKAMRETDEGTRLAIDELSKVDPGRLDPANAEGLFQRSRQRIGQIMDQIGLRGANPALDIAIEAFEKPDELADVAADFDFRSARDTLIRTFGSDDAELMMSLLVAAQGNRSIAAQALADATLLGRKAAAGNFTDDVADVLRGTKSFDDGTLGTEEQQRLFASFRSGEPPRFDDAPPPPRGPDAPSPTPVDPPSVRGRLPTLAASALGAGIAAELESRVEREGNNFIPTAAIAGGLLAFGFMRFMQSPAVRDALLNFASFSGPRSRTARNFIERVPAFQAQRAGDAVDIADPDLEKLFRATLIDWLPDNLRASDQVFKNTTLAAATVAGGTAAGALANFPEQDDTTGANTLLAGAIGAGLAFAVTRRGLGRMLKRDWSPRRAIEQLFLEDAGQPDEFVKQKQRLKDAFHGRIMEIRQTVDALDRLGPEVGGQVDDFLRGNLALDALPEVAQIHAARTRLIFDELALDLIDVGIAQGAIRETIQTNLGSYVPRLYLAYERGEADRLLRDLDSWGKSRGLSRFKMGDLDGLKKRKDLPEHLRSALGEIKDHPGYLLARRGIPTAQDIENRRMLNWLASSQYTMPNGVLRRDISDAEAFRFAQDSGIPVPDPRHPIAYQRRMGWRFPKSQDEQRALVDRVRQDLDDLKEEMLRLDRGDHPEAEAFTEKGRRFARWQGRRFMQMPKDTRYGPLAGRYVDEQVAVDQITTAQTPETFLQLLEAFGTGTFKTSKVLWNPATLARNLVSNLVLLDQAGVSPVWRSGRSAYVEAWRQFPLPRPGRRGVTRPEGPLFVEARRHGLFGGEFRQAEVAELLDGIGDSKVRGATVASLLVRNMKRIGPLQQMERFHEASEQMSKMVAYVYGRETLGMEAADAVRFAKKWIFDYREVPEWVNVTRRSLFGAPFITFSYKAIPRVLENALAAGDPQKAARFWKWPVIFGAANEGSARLMGIDPESGVAGEFKGDRAFIPTLKRITKAGLGIGDPHGFKKWLPDYAGPSQILFPYTDTFGRQMSFDATWYFPWGDLGEFGQGNLGRQLGRAGVAYPRWLEPSNPWLHAMVAGISGRDAFTGRDIRSPEATPYESAADWTRYMLRMWGPQLLNPEGRSYEKLRRAFSTDLEVDPYTPAPMTAVLSEVAGFKTRPFDPGQSMQFRMRERNKAKAKIQMELRFMARSGAPKATIQRKLRALKELDNRFVNRFGMDPPAMSPELIDALLDQAERRGEELSQGFADQDFFGLGPNVFPSSTPEELLPGGATRATNQGLFESILRGLIGTRDTEDAP